MPALSIVPESNKTNMSTTLLSNHCVNSVTHVQIPYGVVGPHANPVRNRPVLPHLLRQLLLNHKCLV
ncbi:hypothetical protein Hanom_Chr05g00401541 [Helianthus anomalus]